MTYKITETHSASNSGRSVTMERTLAKKLDEAAKDEFIKKNYPGLTFREDENGNMIAIQLVSSAIMYPTLITIKKKI